MRRIYKKRIGTGFLTLAIMLSLTVNLGMPVYAADYDASLLAGYSSSLYWVATDSSGNAYVAEYNGTY